MRTQTIRTDKSPRNWWCPKISIIRHLVASISPPHHTHTHTHPKTNKYTHTRTHTHKHIWINQMPSKNGRDIAYKCYCIGWLYFPFSFGWSISIFYTQIFVFISVLVCVCVCVMWQMTSIMRWYILSTTTVPKIHPNRIDISLLLADSFSSIVRFVCFYSWFITLFRLWFRVPEKNPNKISREKRAKR